MEGPPQAGRLVATAFVLAIVGLALARVLVQWGWTSPAFWLAIPVVLFVLVAMFGWAIALLGVGFLMSAAFALRSLVDGPGGWVVILLAPVVAFTGMLARRIVRVMRQRDGGAGAGPPG